MDDMIVNALVGLGELTLIVLVSVALVGLGYVVKHAFTKNSQ